MRGTVLQCLEHGMWVGREQGDRSQGLKSNKSVMLVLHFFFIRDHIYWVITMTASLLVGCARSNHWIITITIWNRYSSSPHFTDGTERWKIICPKVHSWWIEFVFRPAELQLLTSKLPYPTFYLTSASWLQCTYMHLYFQSCHLLIF
jgi:hypothetical protein